MNEMSYSYFSLLRHVFPIFIPLTVVNFLAVHRYERVYVCITDLVQFSWDKILQLIAGTTVAQILWPQQMHRF